MIPHVQTVVPMVEQKLLLQFDTGETKIFDMSPYLSLGGFAKLSDPLLFSQVRVAFGTVEWPNGLDLDPEDLYQLSV